MAGTPQDLDVLKLLVKGPPRTVEDVLEIGLRVIGSSPHVSVSGNAEQEAKELLRFCLGGGDLPDDTVVLSRPMRERYLSLAARRAAGEPFAFITGWTSFHGMELKVKPGVFIPREICDALVKRAVRRLRPRTQPTALDLCTGIGAIAMAIAKEVPAAHVVGTDISPQSLILARTNAKRLGFSNLTFHRSDLYRQVPRTLRGTIDVITAYTPFVPVWELFRLPAEAREYEPVFSFTDMSLDGTAALRAVIDEAHAWLRPSGWLLLQIASEHEPVVGGLLEHGGLRSIKSTPAESAREVVMEGQSVKRKSRSRTDAD